MATLMAVPAKADLDAAEAIVRRHMAPTPAYRWPLLDAAVGAEVWVKHENHSPIGAFKVRGGLVYLERLRRRRPDVAVVSATRGNHGLSLAHAGRARGVSVTVVVPRGNNPDKNAGMCALGARVVEDGRDFDEAREVAERLAAEHGWELVRPFHPDLVAGVATYARELFAAADPLEAVYVPVGMGSGICGLIAVRDLLGLATEIVGVVAEGAPAYAESWRTGRLVRTAEAATFVDGVACRSPDPDALAAIRAGAARVIAVSDGETAAAMRLMHSATHNLAEPAGAIALAGLWRERERRAGRPVAVVHTGGNVDAATLAAVQADRIR